MDIVIPYRNSPSNGLELRYTLRGIERYVPDCGNVFIIGDCPGFIHNVIHISAKDTPERMYKQRNICKKLLLACKDVRVSDSFAWFSDDHFLLRTWLPDYNYDGTLRDALLSYTLHQTYRQTLFNTLFHLGEGYDYGHGPILFQKELFARTMEGINWNEPWGYAIKSLYCGLNNINGEQYPDCKIKVPLAKEEILAEIDGRPYFSIGDQALNDIMVSILQELYPSKSLYENT